jgi:hypothetical protein
MTSPTPSKDLLTVFFKIEDAWWGREGDRAS